MPLTRTRQVILTTIVWLAGAVLTGACAAAPNQLESIYTTALPDGGAEIVLTMDSTVTSPRIFTTSNPAQLAIDLPATAIHVDQRYHQVEAGPVTGLTLAAANRRSRIVVALSQPVRYAVRHNGNTLRISIHADTATPANAPAANTSPATAPAADSVVPVVHRATIGVANGAGVANTNTLSAPANRVTNVDFRRGPDAAGRLEISLTGTGGPIDVNSRDGKIIAVLPQTHLPSRLEKRLDVRDFATPVKAVDVFSRGDNTRVSVTPFAGAKFTHTSQRQGDQFILTFTPIAQAPVVQTKPKNNKPHYSGKKISLSFQKMDIRSVLQIIADVANVNMVVADNVQGEVTLRLNDVPWDQALHLVLSSHGLGMQQVGKVMKIAPLGQIAARQQAELTAYKATHDLTPLRTEIIQINYAPAGDIAKVIQAGSGKTAMLSERGRVTVDARTNSLLVTDTPKRIAGIKTVIQQLDNPVRQVMVKTRIVEANRGFSRELGVTMAGASDTGTGVPTVGGFSDHSGFTVNLPAASSAGSFVTSIVSGSFALDLALNAMETEDRGKIISEPRVITTDGQEAVIEQGTEIPYTTVSDNGTDVQFKEVLLNLTVTPHITPNEQVLLNMEVTQDTVANFSVKGEPAIATRRLKTQVLVDNGNTVVLGGIFKQEDRRQKSKVPLLGDAPIIGVLFSNRMNKKEQRELLLFITPNILEKSLTSK